MRRVTIAGLMAAVLLFAVALAALRFASELWAGVVLLAVVGLLATAALGVIYRRGATRAGWLGFLLFGGAYATLAFGPWFAVEVLPRLPTTPLLRAADAYLHPRVEVEEILTTPPGGPFPGTRLGLSRSGVVTPLPAPPAGPGLFAASGREEDFQRVGHGLVALACGLAGAVVARRFERTAAAGSTARLGATPGTRSSRTG